MCDARHANQVKYVGLGKLGMSEHTALTTVHLIVARYNTNVMLGAPGDFNSTCCEQVVDLPAHYMQEFWHQACNTLFGTSS